MSMSTAEFLQRIGTAAWSLDFNQFCERLNCEPKDAFARDKWDALQKLARAANRLDPDTLDKLIADDEPVELTFDEHLFVDEPSPETFDVSVGD